MGIVWVIIIGLVAGFIAKLLSPGPNNPSGFILTAVLGVVGAFLELAVPECVRNGQLVEVSRSSV